MPPQRRITVFGGVATFAGLGLIAGPAFAGLLSERFRPGSALLMIVFLGLRTPLWSVVSTISNPLCAHGCELAGVSTGFGLALMNLCWAAATWDVG